jgi:hypothetical protein
MSNCNGHRWSKFWWADWQSDAALRMCSLGARGLWMELLCLAHEAEPVGQVLVNGRQPTPRQLAAIVGASEREVTRYLTELEEAGVFSRTENGAIFSRRMVKDAAQSEAGREAVSKRWSKKPTHANGEDPNSLPNRSANTEPSTRSLEAESEAEERNPPQPSHAVGGGRRADFSNPRALGTNPRAQETNPRVVGLNPRAKPKYRNGFIQSIENDVLAKRNGKSVSASEAIDAIWLAIGEVKHAH